jgi:hypothetical protein
MELGLLAVIPTSSEDAIMTREDAIDVVFQKRGCENLYLNKPYYPFTVSI